MTFVWMVLSSLMMFFGYSSILLLMVSFQMLPPRREGNGSLLCPYYQMKYLIKGYISGVYFTRMRQMMDRDSVLSTLAGAGLAAVRYFEQIDSTNAEAARWLESGAPHLSLVLADEQTAGRGRAGRQWFTPPGAGLAMSLLVTEYDLNTNSPSVLADSLSLFPGLGAVATAQMLESECGLAAEIKWPNDVLVAGRKVAGVLAEAHWMGGRLLGAVLGIGINVYPESIPPGAKLNFPAASIADCLQVANQIGIGDLDRLRILRAVVESLIAWLPRLNSTDFLNAWNSRLAWRGEFVQVWQVLSPGHDGNAPVAAGKLLDLDQRGRLRLAGEDGQVTRIESGELRLRLAR
jgi:BirA family transcriptional regulator, biotin operon repressor / biotin---[acetyl-CoA-carboxylase] ligase